VHATTELVVMGKAAVRNIASQEQGRYLGRARGCVGGGYCSEPRWMAKGGGLPQDEELGAR
jgi:hypothetical protein